MVNSVPANSCSDEVKYLGFLSKYSRRLFWTRILAAWDGDLCGLGLGLEKEFGVPGGEFGFIPLSPFIFSCSEQSGLYLCCKMYLSGSWVGKSKVRRIESIVLLSQCIGRQPSGWSLWPSFFPPKFFGALRRLTTLALVIVQKGYEVGNVLRHEITAWPGSRLTRSGSRS